MIYRFGHCALDADGYTLSRNGEVVAVEPRVFEVLLYLVQHRDRVVSREELFDQFWPDTYVGDGSLTRCLSQARQSIGQTRSTPVMIQTVRGRGYRFVAEVTLPPEDVAESTAHEAPPEPTPPESEFAPERPPFSLSPAPPSPSPHAAERRYLTVLSCAFADLDISMSHLDPEDLYERSQSHRAASLAIIDDFDGHVAYQNDATLEVYFGFPRAHEDDAQRALHAALGLVRALGQKAMGSVRIGIHTGWVIAETSVSGVPVALGMVPRVAEKLQALAAPETVVISEATAELTQGYFELKALEIQALDGVAEPLMVYQVDGEAPIQTRLEVGLARGLTPFVGREAQVALLQERWTYVQEGLGQVLLIQGEAGMGKSRLVQHLKEEAANQMTVVMEHRCSPYHQHVPLYPVIDVMHRLLHHQSEPGTSSPLERLELLLAPYDVDIDEAVPLVANLLSIALPEGRYAPLALTPQRQRERTLDLLLSLLLKQASHTPILYVVEDLHWADPSTLDWLRLLMDSVMSAPLLVVLTARPEFEPPWGPYVEMTPVALHRLTRSQTEEMIEQVAGGKQLPVEVLAQLVEKTDGVPLFVEELTRMVLESGQWVEQAGQYELRGALSQLMVPATLHDSLMARLDRLGTAKKIAQWGAVLGREFSEEVLGSVMPDDASVLQSGLMQLVEAGLVIQRRTAPQVHYRFKHALIQDAAYHSLLTRHRQAVHQQIADVFELRFVDIVETQPELLAYHRREAGQTAESIPHWLQAGQRALSHYGHREAMEHLSQGLALLETLPETLQRDRWELDFQLALAYPLELIKGMTSVEMRQVYSRALELCDRVGDIPQRIVTLRGLQTWHMSQGELHTAKAFAEQTLELAQHESGAPFLPVAHQAMGVLAFYLGEFASARVHFTEWLNPASGQPSYRREDRNVALCPANHALTLWMLGYPNQAVQMGRANLARTQSWTNRDLHVLTICHTAALHQWRHEATIVQELCEEGLAICEEEGYSLYGAYTRILLGWALSATGQMAEGLAQLEAGVAAYRSTAATGTISYWLWLQAELYRQHGRAADGLEVLAEALRLVDRAGAAHWWTAELYRLKGELLQTLDASIASKDATPEACLMRAREIAQHQEARSLELRAATSLARLWQGQGRDGEARAQLASVYERFSEGLDTPDLQEARALLHTLE